VFRASPIFVAILTIYVFEVMCKFFSPFNIQQVSDFSGWLNNCIISLSTFRKVTMAPHRYPTPKAEFRDPFPGNIPSCQELTLDHSGNGNPLC
jgi:hypothetical protein